MLLKFSFNLRKYGLFGSALIYHQPNRVDSKRPTSVSTYTCAKQ
ncbi:hypothetical protein JMJ77_0002090 [Colletotrichum scovillei]|uniref:Uncharacterized protein n=1 Tax=Colletotrichum scovillei TaxID=1209932 RepID=A0A9P7UDA6_9PEZI|nr:hypothetical protein JMJ77_0002090 [Colletotrichum scovillei]KAG7070505.1 hypothetical protein JMJ76_0001756 [Colletotrichum scovillei]KAG7078753.1 hypothetical protein JMJ78_0002420 [Colletotrichum scovillei]